VVAGLFFGSAPGAAAPSASAVFMKTDTTTQGSWRGVYGADGHHVIGATAAYPSYASVTPSGHESFVWTASTTDPRGLQKPSPATDRIASCWYSATSFAIDLNMADQVPHQVALYVADWWGSSRSQRFEILDAAGNVLDTRTVSSFAGGQYLVWNISGRVSIRVTNTNPASNAVVLGIFFR
jgi:hypothetical protein